MKSSDHLKSFTFQDMFNSLLRPCKITKSPKYNKQSKQQMVQILHRLKTFKAAFYSSLQVIIFENHNHLPMNRKLP